jgi:transposase-like protein
VRLSTDTAELAVPYRNPEAAPRGRRLNPATLDGIARALRAGVPKRLIARTYGVSATTVRRVAATLTPELATALADLSELADAERELRESGLPADQVELLIATVRHGHLVRRDLERRASS